MSNKVSVGVDRFALGLSVAVVVVLGLFASACGVAVAGQEEEELDGTIGIASSKKDLTTVITVDVKTPGHSGGDGLIDEVFLVKDAVEMLNVMPGPGTLRLVGSDSLEVKLANADDVTFVVATGRQLEDEGPAISGREIEVAAFFRFWAKADISSHEKAVAVFIATPLDEETRSPRD